MRCEVSAEGGEQGDALMPALFCLGMHDALALAKELLGLVRSKFSTVPIPGGDLSLNGGDLISQGREEKEALKTKLAEMLEELTYSKMLEDEAGAADSLTNILKKIPIPNGKAIFIG